MNMVRTVLSALVAGVVLFGVQVSGQSTFRSSYHDYRIVNFVEGLVQPWSIAFLPGGDTLITERPGRLRIVRDGKLLPAPVEGLPAVLYEGQGGLLEVAADRKSVVEGESGGRRGRRGRRRKKRGPWHGVRGCRV